jgi:acyl-CoA reductase-like NAD-dependent aldehyde dehydrogenase
MSPTAKVTYISLSADDPALDAAFETAIAKVRGALGANHPLHVAGTTRAAAAPIESRSPTDTRVVVARVATATDADVRDAVAAAREAFPRWSATPWQERAAILDRAADIVRERRLERANDTRFGLTAGLFSREPTEIDAFFDRIQAGVVYVNRAAGATTGAWPGVQPFGGWKGSGSTGKNIGGHYTLLCYLREQSRTLCA